MNLIKLSEVLAIAGPERERLREADEAIRDIVTLIGEQATKDGLNGGLIGAAMVDVLLIAAAKLALAQRPKSELSSLSADFEDLARQAFDWVAAPAAPNALNRPRAPRRGP